jgi:RNA recognition motif-containing protein
MEMIRSASHDSFFSNPKVSKADRRNYCTTSEKGSPNACLFVASLNNQKSLKELEISVRELFQKVGKVADTKVHIDEKNRPFAFVQFYQVSDAQKALMSLKHEILDSRPIRVERANVYREIQVLVPFKASRQYCYDVSRYYGPIERFQACDSYEGGMVLNIKYCYRDDALNAITVFCKFGWNAQW